MIIKFSNLGAIKETELDLRPLTVIIGPNNTNKTYIAYSIYGLWQQFRSSSFLPTKPEYKKKGKRVLSFKINNDFLNSIARNLHLNVRLFKSTLGKYFQDSSGRLFSRTDFALDILSDEIRWALELLISKGSMPSYYPDTSLMMSLKNDILFIEIETSEFWMENTQLIGRFQVERSLLEGINKKLFSNPFLLPAERNAFILTYKLLANRRYKMLKQTQRELFDTENEEITIKQRHLELMREQGDILYPQPIEDFWDFLTDLEFQQSVRIGTDEKNEFQLLADDIETHIQNRNKTKLTSTKLGGREIKVNVKRGLSIDLYNASSSIKQLAPLLLYLRYRAAENDLLIIDEPEMGLHPESQARLLEALGILVNLGVKVLLTTHSPYFMAHLNNLVNGDMENPDVLKSQAKSLYMKDERAFLSMEQVSAYEMKDNKLCSLKDEDYGIRWDTLSDVSANIQQKFFEIFEKREAVSHGKEK